VYHDGEFAGAASAEEDFSERKRERYAGVLLVRGI
jgi:hypothetical protein